VSFLSFLSVGIPSSSRLVYRPVYPQAFPATGSAGGKAHHPKPHGRAFPVDSRDYKREELRKWEKLKEQEDSEIQAAIRQEKLEELKKLQIELGIVPVEPAVPEVSFEASPVSVESEMIAELGKSIAQYEVVADELSLKAREKLEARWRDEEELLVMLLAQEL